MNKTESQPVPCAVYTGRKNLSCRPEVLYLLEDLGTAAGSRNLLKACGQCGQVYKEVVRSDSNGKEYSSYYLIEGRRTNQCHCIGYLAEVAVVREEKSCEGDAMYFTWEKETRMRCRKCGETYLERILQSNHDGFYSQKYEEE